MKCTSKNKKSWKAEMIDWWDTLGCYYQQTLMSPSFKRWMKVCFELCKILFSVLAKKVVEHFFEDF